MNFPILMVRKMETHRKRNPRMTELNEGKPALGEPNRMTPEIDDASIEPGLREQVPARYYSGETYQEPQKSAVSQGAIRKKNLAGVVQ
jgi:hypothetical protein